MILRSHSNRTMAAAPSRGKTLPVFYDRWVLVAIVGLLAIGLLMVTSASIGISYRHYGMSFHYLFRQLAFLGLGFVLALFIIRIPIAYWNKTSSILLLMALILLIAVLIPGIGHQVNGSMRWLSVGPLGLQVSELVKLIAIIYLASFLVRHSEEVKTQFSGFIKPMIVLGIIAALLLKQPDFGATTVIILTALGMMFLAGTRLWQFAGLLILVIVCLGGLAITSPYRLHRLTSFLNPWEHAFQGGYQLTQSLIAFGRGGLNGVGLGESVQKLFYLPEAHTDFIFAVLAEELGLIGTLTVILFFAVLVVRAMQIGRKAEQLGEMFSAYVAYGIGLWIALQVLINLGVNCGMLPTKGLTLPLISYGGSSLSIMCMALAILLRIDHENRLLIYGFSKTRRQRK